MKTRLLLLIFGLCSTLTYGQLGNTYSKTQVDVQLSTKVSSLTSAAQMLGTTDKKLFFDGSEWERKTGSFSADGVMRIAATGGAFYERQYTGQLPIEFFKSLVTPTGDWKPAFQAAVNYLTSKANTDKGGDIQLGPYVYPVSGISLGARVRIIGMSRGVSIIKLISGSNTSVVTIPKTALQASLQHLTIDGNKTGNTSGHGIFIEGAGDSDGHNQNQLWQKETTGASSYSYYQLDDVTITQCAGDGLHIPGTGGGGANYAMVFNNIFSEYNNGQGIFNASTDNLFTNIYVEKNGSAGILEIGSNNKWTSVKTIWNAQTDKVNGGGVRVTGNRNSFVQVEAQDNFSHGFIDQGQDNFYTACLADGNGYISPANTLSNRTTYGFYMKNSNGTRFSNCKATNYRNLQSDGYYIQERGYFIEAQSQNIGTPDIDVHYRHNTPSQPEMTSPLTLNKGELLSYRTVSTSVTSGTVTQVFVAGEPAITSAGLHVADNDRIQFPHVVNVDRSMSVVVDFVYNGSSGGTQPRILTSDNNALDIHLGEVGENKYLYFRVKVKDITRTAQLAFTPTAGTSYRATLRIKTVNDVLRMQGYLSQEDVGSGPKSLTYAVGSFSLAAGESIDLLRNLSINNQVDKILATYQRILITPDFIGDRELYQSSGLDKYVANSLLYIHFPSYKRPAELWFYGSTPPASVYYRGMTLIQRSEGGYSDRKLTCIRRYDGVYTWNIENFFTQFAYNKPATGSWDSGAIVWNAGLTSTTAANGATQEVIGWKAMGGGIASLTPLLVNTSDQNIIGQGAGYPTSTILPSSSRFLFWRNSDTGQTNIWWNAGSGTMRALTPVGGSQSITGTGSQQTYTIAHGLGYTPTILTISGVNHGNLTADGTNISFTATVSASTAVYWTAR